MSATQRVLKSPPKEPVRPPDDLRRVRTLLDAAHVLASRRPLPSVHVVYALPGAFLQPPLPIARRPDTSPAMRFAKSCVGTALAPRAPERMDGAPRPGPVHSTGTSDV